MTELEEKFFNTFGIRKAIIHPCTDDKRCVFEHQICGDCYYAHRYNFYPPITDHILYVAIGMADEIKSEVRKLFEE